MSRNRYESFDTYVKAHWMQQQQAKDRPAVKVDTKAPFCKRCHAVMVKRSGQNVQFWGCSRYPQCKYTLAI